MDAPRKIEQCFERKEDLAKLELILNPENGLYRAAAQQLREGLEANDLDPITQSLEKLKNINKTLLVMSTRRLHELASQKKGDLV